MRALARLTRGAIGPLLLVLGLAATACGDGERPDDPRWVALQLFAVARDAPADRAAVDALLVEPPAPGKRAALDEALVALGRVGAPRVLSVEALEPIDRVAVELEGAADGGGVGHWSVQLTRRGERFAISWFAGPGVQWPRRSGRGSGLTTSDAAGAGNELPPHGDPR